LISSPLIFVSDSSPSASLFVFTTVIQHLGGSLSSTFFLPSLYQLLPPSQPNALDKQAPPEDRARLMELAETEVMSLHEGNFARYHVRPSEYQAWREGWH
jgi:hypothetical protein